MLREYALTPHIFDGDDTNNCDRDEWFDTLKTFVHRLLRLGKRTEIPGVVISNYSGEIFASELNHICASCKSHKMDLRSLQRHLQKHFVPRNLEGDYPSGNEEDWIAEARQTTSSFPVDRIVATKSLPSTGEEQEVFGLHDLEESFWDDPDSTLWLPPVIEMQVEALGKLLRFSSAIALVCPYFGNFLELRNGVCVTLPEAAFPIKLLVEKIRSHSQSVPLERIELLTNPLKGYERPEEKALTAQRIAEYIRDSVPVSSFDVAVFISDKKLIQRRILLGEAREDDFYPRWGIFMDHYARENDLADGEKQKFCLGKDIEISETRSYYFPSERYQRNVSFTLPAVQKNGS